ncbi:hypothetical protein KR074_002368 [Drosophila pseudoananassae]|nr:hypothetical protein KR074_002368 [Drosophila pseudoananassae]
MLNEELSLEEVVSLYSASILLFLLTEEGQRRPFHQRLELLNGIFNYSDTLKPTMIHYATVEIMHNIKLISVEIEYCYLYLLEVIPHILVSSDTGKMISLCLLRGVLADLSNSTVILNIYRNLCEAWEMIQLISQDTILKEWSLRKTYILVRVFSLTLASAVLNSSNQGLKTAGYRGFDLPPGASELCDWFRTLKDRLDEKYKQLKSREGLMLVRFIEHNIIGYLTETANESMSEAGTEAVSEPGNDTTA